MQNYNIYYGEKVITVRASQEKTNEFGQFVLLDYSGNTLAIVPKEILVIATDDLSGLQCSIQRIIDNLPSGFNDIERKLPNFQDYRKWHELKRVEYADFFRKELIK